MRLFPIFALIFFFLVLQYNTHLGRNLAVAVLVGETELPGEPSGATLLLLLHPLGVLLLGALLHGVGALAAELDEEHRCDPFGLLALHLVVTLLIRLRILVLHRRDAQEVGSDECQQHTQENGHDAGGTRSLGERSRSAIGSGVIPALVISG